MRKSRIRCDDPDVTSVEDQRLAPGADARILPGHCHDALKRLLPRHPRLAAARHALVDLRAAWPAGRLGRALGDARLLCLDDVVVEKAFAKRLPWAG
jgi:hypothetical protein